jgi:hypothetical protein
MINAPSLIPAQRVLRRKRRARSRLWAAALGALAIAGAAGSVGARAWLLDRDGVSSSELQAAETRLADLTTQRSTLLQEWSANAATLRAVRAASDHPDWSILLAFVAKLGADRVTLDLFSLEPASGAEGFDIRVEGVGRTQQDVARFVLGLETAGVFSSTRLERSGAEEARDGVPFSVVCLIRPEPPGGAAAPTTPPTAPKGAANG